MRPVELDWFPPMVFPVANATVGMHRPRYEVANREHGSAFVRKPCDIGSKPDSAEHSRIYGSKVGPARFGHGENKTLGHDVTLS